jgi:hypothetical protein
VSKVKITVPSNCSKRAKIDDLRKGNFFGGKPGSSGNSIAFADALMAWLVSCFTQRNFAKFRIYQTISKTAS